MKFWLPFLPPPFFFTIRFRGRLHSFILIFIFFTEQCLKMRLPYLTPFDLLLQKWTIYLSFLLQHSLRSLAFCTQSSFTSTSIFYLTEGQQGSLFEATKAFPAASLFSSFSFFSLSHFTYIPFITAREKQLRLENNKSLCHYLPFPGLLPALLVVNFFMTVRRKAITIRQE